MPTQQKGAKKKLVASKKPSSAKGPSRARGRSKTKKAALVYASPDQCFWTTDGRILSNLIELRDTLSGMANEVFEYHVSKDKNDFADWVGSVLRDPDLAKALRKARKSSAAHTVVMKRLKIYDI